MALGNGTSHERYTADAQEQVSAVNDLRAAYSALAEQQVQEYERVAAAQAKVTGGLAEGSREAQGLGSGLGNSLTNAKGALVAIAATVAAAGLALRSFNAETERLDKIAKDSVKFGFDAQEFQRLDHMATLSGTSIDAVATASLKLNLNLRAIADGGGKQAAGALRDIGVTSEQLSGLSTPERLAFLADKLNGVQDKGQRAAIAVELFGKQGRELLPMLAAGSEGIAAMNSELDRTYTAAELARVEKYEDATTRLNHAAQDFKTELVIGLAPALEETTNFLTKSAKGWATAFNDPNRAAENFWSNLTGIREEAVRIGGLSLFSDQKAAIVGLFETAKARNMVEEANVELLEQGAGNLDHQVRLAEAQGVTGAELEALYRAQYQAKIDLLTATGDIAALEAAQRDEEVRQAAVEASARKRSFGQRITEAQKIEQYGKATIERWTDQVQIMEMAAQLGGKAEESAASVALIRHRIAQEELEFERAALEATRPKNSLERASIAARLEGIDRAREILELEKQLTQQLELQAEAEQRQAAAGASIEAESQALSNVVELEDYKLGQRAQQLEQEGLLSEAYGLRLEQLSLQTEAQQRELELRKELILAQDPETEAERIQQKMDLERIEHEQTMGLLKSESEARKLHENEAKRLFKSEKERREAGFKQAISIAEQTSQVATAGGELASFIAQQTIKDEEKRQAAVLRVQGGILMALGAVEVAKAVAAYASLNIPQGLAHTAAAAISFAKGGMMLAGQIPGAGGAGAGASAASAPREARERDTSDSGVTVPGSVPAADRGPQRIGGEGPSTAGQGGPTIVINNPNGSIDEDFAEKMAKAIRNAGNGSEAA